MRSLFSRSVVPLVAILLVLSSCGRAKTFDVQVIPPKLEPGQMQSPSPIAAADRALAHQYARDREIVVLTMIAARTSPPTRGSFRHVEPRPPSMTDAASFEPCGGQYPPCWRVQTESRGQYGAYNPSGCGGNGCYGKWQFSGAWAGKLGLPSDIAHATPQQQDNAARLLWAGGQGCSNWEAC